ncbi:MAG: membrane protein insertion efficiency factor YidD [Pseudobdellovibrio sp.]
MDFIRGLSIKNLSKYSLNKFFVGLIKFYQLALSRFFGGHCRFYPSCSHYALECYTKLGFFAASKYTIIRLSKCHPLSFKSGYDPVPLTQNELNK